MVGVGLLRSLPEWHRLFVEVYCLAGIHCGADTLELDTNIVGVWHIGGMLSQSLFSVN